MNAKFLVYHDSALGQVVVLQAKCEEFDFLRNYGRDFEDWPRDLGIYEQTNGLWIWEGVVDEEGETWKGNWRELTEIEIAHLTEGNLCL